MSGPYESSADAQKDAACVWQGALQKRHASPLGQVGQINEGLLLGALRTADVSLGMFDKRIAGWLADFEPEVVHVVIGWIQRAAEAGAAHAAGNQSATPMRAEPVAPEIHQLLADAREDR